ncbi:hypothetical protein [Vibrio metschnikovii]|uniref:Flavodoxin n=3 Tax=Unclassified Bacteria TaxID=49928 RepID=A0AAU6TLY8_UNCXX
MTHLSSSNDMQALIDAKNQWLYDQVDVQFPTPESLQGLTVYQTLNQALPSEAFTAQHHVAESHLAAIYLVDFHRLTIMFALLQATRCEQAAQQALLVEFFTQIIYSPPCRLYLGFTDAQPMAAAIVTCDGSSLLISDVVMQNNPIFTSSDEFVSAVVAKYQQENLVSGSIYIEYSQP